MWKMSREGDAVWRWNDDGTAMVCSLDFAEYLAWVAEGNTPESWEPESN